MDVEKSASQPQVYKNGNWPERKKELKATRNQRTTKSIKNIRVIDTPCDSAFNCTFPSDSDCSIDAPSTNGKSARYCDITGYEVDMPSFRPSIRME